jgi:hypothetical protein
LIEEKRANPFKSHLNSLYKVLELFPEEEEDIMEINMFKAKKVQVNDPYNSETFPELTKINEIPSGTGLT